MIFQNHLRPSSRIQCLQPQSRRIPLIQCLDPGGPTHAPPPNQTQPPKKRPVELPQVPSPNPIDPGGGACFVADTLVVIDEKPTEQQTESAAQLHMPLDENVSDYDRAFWYLLAIGAIGVGGLQIYLNRERHKQQREQDAARQLRDGKSFAIYWKRKYGEPFELPDPVLLEQAEENDDARNKDALSAEATELPLSSESTVIAQMDRRCETMVDFHRIKTTDSAEDSRDAVENKAAPTANRSFAHWFNAGWILMWTVALACVIGASTLPSQAPDSPSSVNSVSIASKQLTYRPIDKIQIGDRVFAQNPTGKHDDSLGEVEPRTWRKITLRAPKRDGTYADVSLLRPKQWLQERDAYTGGTIEIAVPECGIDGHAEVSRIEPCPPLKPGRGSIVTGTYKHQSARILDLWIDGHGEPIGTTANHLFWSEDRFEFIRADHLTSGEKLRANEGPIRVTALVVQRARHGIQFGS